MNAAPAARDADPYSGLAPTDAAWLRERTGVVFNFFRQSADNIVRIGRVLREVKGRLPHGRFMRWVAASLPFNHSVAARMMQVAEQFGEIPHGGNFDAGALYLLAQANTPPAARGVALERAGRGHRITLDVARNLVRMHAGSRGDDEEPDDDEPGEDDTPLEAAGEPAPAADPGPAAGASPEAVGRAVVSLMRSGATVHLSEVRDTDCEAGAAYSATVYDADDRADIRARVHDDPGELILIIAGMEPLKRCQTCGEPKPLYSGFPRHAGRADGRGAACKVCERKRLSDFKQRKKGGRDG